MVLFAKPQIGLVKKTKRTRKEENLRIRREISLKSLFRAWRTSLFLSFITSLMTFSSPGEKADLEHFVGVQPGGVVLETEK